MIRSIKYHDDNWVFRWIDVTGDTKYVTLDCFLSYLCP